LTPTPTPHSPDPNPNPNANANPNPNPKPTPTPHPEQARDEVNGAVQANGRDTKTAEHAEALAAQAAADSAWDAATKRAHTSVSEQARTAQP